MSLNFQVQLIFVLFEGSNFMRIFRVLTFNLTVVLFQSRIDITLSI